MIRENWNLNNYQMQARKFAVYPERASMTYPALGLAGEAGEVADKVKRIHRGDYADGRDDTRFKAEIAKEIGTSCGTAPTLRKTWATLCSKLQR